VVSRFAVSGLRRVVRTALPGIGAGLLLGGCGSSQIAASTTCKDYLAQSEESRHDAAVRISSETRGLSDPGNPMWGLSLDAACGSDPNMTVGQYFARGSGAPTQSGTSSESETSSQGALPESILSEPAFTSTWEQLEGINTVALEGSTVIFYLVPHPEHAAEIWESLKAACSNILHSEPFTAVKFEFTGGRVLTSC
jgi:hypothetical protein